MNILKQLFILFTLLFLQTGCSDSQPQKLLLYLEDDCNTTTLDTQREVNIHVYAHFDDNSQQEVTDELLWRSSNSSLASVQDGDIQTFDKEGDVAISYETYETATDKKPLFSKTLHFKVAEIKLLNIEIIPANLILYEGEKAQLKAIGNFENNTTFDITKDCHWSSENPIVATVTQDALIEAHQEGSVIIRAKNADIMGFINLTVRKLAYTSIFIDTTQTTFNVEQNITLKVYGIEEDNITQVVIPNEQLNFYTSDDSIISLDTDTIIAQSKGEAQISAELKSDSNIYTSTTFKVEKDNYLRIFKNGVEVGFPYAQTQEYQTFPEDQFDTFKLRAVGGDFKISSLWVSDFNGNIYPTSVAWFDGLQDNDTIFNGQEREYILKHNNTQQQLQYFYKIDDAFNNSFTQKYKVTQ
jgi:hypothetical protein